MSGRTGEVTAASIVFIGSFNPKIFHPAWFASEELLSKEEAKAASDVEVTGLYAKFELEWATIEVTQERFSALSNQAPMFEALRDLVLGAFRLLRHTPVRAMGLNWSTYLPVDSDEQSHRLADKVVPIEFWRSFLEEPKVRSLTIEGVRMDSYNGYARLRVEPFARRGKSIFVIFNDHFDFSADEEPRAARRATDVLSEDWNPSYDRASNAISAIGAVL